MEALGGKASTINGLGGIGDICLTCYGSLSRNRSVGVRLGQGEALQDILASSPQVSGLCVRACVQERKGGSAGRRGGTSA